MRCCASARCAWVGTGGLDAYKRHYEECHGNPRKRSCQDLQIAADDTKMTETDEHKYQQALDNLKRMRMYVVKSEEDHNKKLRAMEEKHCKVVGDLEKVHEGEIQSQLNKKGTEIDFWKRQCKEMLKKMYEYKGEISSLRKSNASKNYLEKQNAMCRVMQKSASSGLPPEKRRKM